MMAPCWLLQKLVISVYGTNTKSSFRISDLGYNCTQFYKTINEHTNLKNPILQILCLWKKFIHSFSSLYWKAETISAPSTHSLDFLSSLPPPTFSYCSNYWSSPPSVWGNRAMEVQQRGAGGDFIGAEPNNLINIGPLTPFSLFLSPSPLSGLRLSHSCTLSNDLWIQLVVCRNPECSHQSFLHGR